MAPSVHSARVPPRIRGAVVEFRRRLGARFGERLLDLRLFGSYARGDWGPNSDADVLVVVEGMTRPEQKEVFSAAADLFLERLVRVSPLALSREQYAVLERGEFVIAREIARDGVSP